MFLYHYNTPNNKPRVNKRLLNSTKQDSYQSDIKNKQKGVDSQTISPFHSQYIMNSLLKPKASDNLTTSVGLSKKTTDPTKASQLSSFTFIYPNRDASVGRQQLKTSNGYDNDPKPNLQGSPTKMRLIKDKKKLKKADSLIYNYISSFSRGKSNTRKVFSANQSQEGSICHNDKSGSSLKRKLQFENIQPKETFQSIKPIEGYRNDPKAVFSSSLSKETDYASNVNANPFHANIASNKLTSIHSCVNDSFSTPFPSLTALNQLEGKLRSTLTDPKFASRSKRYNFIKSIFEELILLYPIEQQVLMSEILSSYHAVVLSFSKENKELKEVNDSYQNRLFVNEKKHLDMLSLLKWKEKEIETFKKNLQDNTKPESAPAQVALPLSVSLKKQLSLYSSFSEMKEKDDNENEDIAENLGDNNYIEGLNKKNIEDLDGLYFPDKVRQGSTLISHQAIPTLQLDKDVINKVESRQKRAKVIYANILDMIEKEEQEAFKPNQE